MNTITMPERLTRELQIIEQILKIQLQGEGASEQFYYPFLINYDGKIAESGRYISHCHLCSNVELGNAEVYKNHFTTRYETATKTNIIEAQLKEAYSLAVSIVDYYNDNLIIDTPIITAFNNDYEIRRKSFFNKNLQQNKSVEKKPKELRNAKEEITRLDEKYHETIGYYDAVVIVRDYQLHTVILGTDKQHLNPKWIEGDDFNKWYMVHNFQLVKMCLSIIDFTVKCGIGEKYKLNRIDNDGVTGRMEDCVETDAPGTKILGPEFALFCSILHPTIIQKGFDESKPDYCKRVADTLKIEAPINARKYFNEEMKFKKGDKRIKKILELIIPKIDPMVAESVKSLIKNHTEQYS